MGRVNALQPTPSSRQVVPSAPGGAFESRTRLRVPPPPPRQHQLPHHTPLSVNLREEGLFVAPPSVQYAQESFLARRAPWLVSAIAVAAAAYFGLAPRLSPPPQAAAVAVPKAPAKADELLFVSKSDVGERVAVPKAPAKADEATRTALPTSVAAPQAALTALPREVEPPAGYAAPANASGSALPVRAAAARVVEREPIEAPAPAVSTGSVRIATTNEPVRVFWGDHALGTTPIVAEVPAGAQVFRLQPLDGGPSRVISVNAQAGHVVFMRVPDLTPAPTAAQAR